MKTHGKDFCSQEYFLAEEEDVDVDLGRNKGIGSSGGEGGYATTAGNLAKTQHAAMQPAALFKSGLTARCRKIWGPKRAHGASAPGCLFFFSLFRFRPWKGLL